MNAGITIINMNVDVVQVTQLIWVMVRCVPPWYCVHNKEMMIIGVILIYYHYDSRNDYEYSLSTLPKFSSSKP